MSGLSSPSNSPGGLSSVSPQRRLILIGLGGGLIFLALVCMALAIFSATGGGNLLGPRKTPTSSASNPVPTEVLVTPDPKVPVTVTAPSKLEIKGRTFEVLPVEVTKGTWPYQRGKPGSAVWVFGTLVNQVIGIEANPDNTSLLQGLTEADSIKTTTYAGKTFTFRYSGRQWVTVDKTDVFHQSRPGLTLVLLGEKGDQRLVVSTAYVAESEAASIGQTSAKPGTLVDVAGARVTALNGKVVRGAPDVPPGNAYFVVDFSVTSVQGVLDASQFQTSLIDSAGKPYAMSIPGSQAGSFGPPGGQLLPNTTITASVGYVVPDPLPGSAVVWTFSPRAGAAAPARFAIPIAGAPPTPDPRAQAVVQITQARFSPDGTQVIISGGIGNTAREPINVTLGDINLQSGTTLIPVQATEPALPWVLQPGQNLAFTVTFQRPPQGSAILRVLRASFELSNLP